MRKKLVVLISLMVLPFMASCGGSSGSDGNTSPAAQINSPAEGSAFMFGDPIEFEGSGLDSEDGVVGGAFLVWSSDVDGPICEGESCTSDTLSPGPHQITLTATDSQGATGADTVTISVHDDALPVVQITSPVHGSAFAAGDPIQFAGTGIDTEEGALSGAALVWRSDAAGPIGTGQSFTLNTLSAGSHQITLTATNAQGHVGTNTVSITINANAAPVAQITSPANGSAFVAGELIQFTGTGTDTEEGDLSGAALVWRSNVAGLIGTGQSFTLNTLSAGFHQITLTATDAQGATGSASVTVSITAHLNAAPVAQINSPANGSAFTAGDPIQFAGTGIDTEEGALSGAALVWRSNVAGLIGTGQSFTLNTLSAGFHQITLTATDAQGATGSALVAITINAAAAQVVAPVIDPPGGASSSLNVVAITCDTPGAEIRYTTDGSAPSRTNGTVYTAPLEIYHSLILQAFAWQDGLQDSPIAEAVFTITPAGFGTPVDGHPNWQERLALVYINALRMAPQEFKTDYAFLDESLAGLQLFTATHPVYPHIDLYKSARAHSEDMYDSGVLSHDSSIAKAILYGDSDWDVRIQYFFPRARETGENIAYGYNSPLSVVKMWLDDMTIEDSERFIDDTGQRWIMMTPRAFQAGTGFFGNAPMDYYWTYDAISDRPGATSPVPSAGHDADVLSPGHVSFLLNYYDSSENGPWKVLVYIDDVEYPMDLDIGTDYRGTYRIDQPKATACRSYWFLVVRDDGAIWRYPAAGQFQTWGEGGCATDHTP